MRAATNIWDMHFEVPGELDPANLIPPRPGLRGGKLDRGPAILTRVPGFSSTSRVAHGYGYSTRVCDRTPLPAPARYIPVPVTYPTRSMPYAVRSAPSIIETYHIQVWLSFTWRVDSTDVTGKYAHHHKCRRIGNAGFVAEII